MRVLIVAAVLACTAAAPSGLLAGPYAHGLAYSGAYSGAYPGAYPGVVGHAAPYVGGPVAVAHAAPLVHAAPLAVKAPTIPAGDIQGAQIDAHVEATDHVRAASDAAREYHDQASELQGQAINAAEDHSWQAVDSVKTREAQLDGAAAGAAPIIAKQLAHSHGYAAPLAYAAPAVGYAHGAYAHAPLAHSAVVAHPAPYAHGPVAYAAPHYGLGHGLAHGW